MLKITSKIPIDFTKFCKILYGKGAKQLTEQEKTQANSEFLKMVVYLKEIGALE